MNVMKSCVLIRGLDVQRVVNTNGAEISRDVVETVFSAMKEPECFSSWYLLIQSWIGYFLNQFDFKSCGLSLSPAGKISRYFLV